MRLARLLQVDILFRMINKICRILFIEADSLKEAVSKAEELGCYWDGTELGIDCSCCVDRWLKPFYGYGEVFPKEFEVSDWHSLDCWYRKYGRYEVVEKPVRGFSVRVSSCYEGKIKINNIEDYAQYLVIKYGCTTPDVRIYYKDGSVKEIFEM